MSNKTRTFLALTALLLVSLACATLTGGANDPTATPLPPQPTNTTPPLPTNTSEPLPTDTVSVPSDGITPLAGGEVLFSDDFSDPNSGWDRFSNEDGITDYSNGAYLMGIYQDTYYFWATPYLNFGDKIVKVETQKISGENDMQYGIICQHMNDDNWYALVISGDGYAAIRKRFLGGELEFIADWVQVPAINTGNAANTLQAECIGGRLTLFVNGEFAIEAYDYDMLNGDVGLMTGTFDQSETEVLFDNFTVQAP